MRLALTSLLRNLAAGTRLAFFRPVGARSFRITVGSLLTLVVFVYGLDIVLDAARAGAGATFNAEALPRAVLSTGAMLLIVALLAAVFRQPHLALALGVLLLASQPVLDIAGHAYQAVGERVARWTPFLAGAAWAAWLAAIAWSAAVIARALVLTLSPRPRNFRTAVFGSAVLVMAAAYAVEMRYPASDWWYAARPEAEGEPRVSIVAEQALVRQPRLLAESLAAIAPQRPGVVDTYFVGFAPYANQDVFRKDVETARSVANDRFGIGMRSIALISNPRTVLDVPIATGSNLRASLAAVGERMDRDEDIALVFATSHGSKGSALSVAHAPLELESVDAAGLRSMLDDARIRWRIVVISACYSGSFIPALADAHTMVITAAAADRMSFGCSNDGTLTYFTDAFFNHALRSEATLLGAFARARTLVMERERVEGLSPPSDPQLFVGAAMREKLLALEAPPGSAACAPTLC